MDVEAAPEVACVTAPGGAPPLTSGNAVLKKLRMLSGVDMSREEMHLDAALETDRLKHWEIYLKRWENSLKHASCVWEERWEPDEEKLRLKLLRAGVALDAWGRACLSILNATLDARPVLGGPPEWCTANVLASHDKSLLEELLRGGWIEYHKERVRLGSRVVPTRRVRAMPGGFSFQDAETGARLELSWDLGDAHSGAHDCFSPSAAAAEAVVVVFAPLMRWRMVDDLTGRQVRIPERGVKAPPGMRVLLQNAKLPALVGSVLTTSSTPSKPFSLRGESPPLFQERACTRRIFPGKSGAGFLPWLGAHAWDLRGPPMADCVVYQWTADSCPADVWRCALFSKSKTLVVQIQSAAGGGEEEERVRECFSHS